MHASQSTEQGEQRWRGKEEYGAQKGILNDCHIAKHKHIKSFFQLHLNLQDTMGRQLHLNLQDTIQDKKVINIGYLLGSLLPCIKLGEKKKRGFQETFVISASLRINEPLVYNGSGLR